MEIPGLKEARDRIQRSAFPKFYEMAKHLVSAHMATLEGGDSGSFDGEPDRSKIYAPLSDSNIVGSICTGTFDWSETEFPDRQLHRPVLDIDLPLWVSESTTPNHYHLIIDKEMTWTQYKKLLDVMEEVGILEPGFVSAAEARGASWIRTPWTIKETNG